MTFKKWVEKNLNKKVNPDGVYGVQCVDLIDFYIQDYLKLKKGFWGNAIDWYKSYNNSKWLKNSFIKLNKDCCSVGDVCVSNSGKYGHIFICTKKLSDYEIEYIDQNHTGKGDCITLRKGNINTLSICCVLRPNITYKKFVDYTTYENMNIRNKPSTNGLIKKKSEVTANAKKNCLNNISNAVLKSNTTVTCLSVFKLSNGETWVQIPSGYICAETRKRRYVY